MFTHLLTGGRWRVALLLALALLRLPGVLYGIVDIDESDWMVIGRALGEGWLPYVDIVETKPFLSYLFYAPAALFGFHLWPMQVLALGWVFALCLVVGRTARLWTNDARTEGIAAWICALASCANVLSVNAELMMNLPAAGALLFLARAQRPGGGRADDFGAGLCAGLATLFKHQAGIMLVALLVAAWWHAARVARRWPVARTLSVLAGFALPWGLVAGFYLALGHWAEFYEWNVERNLYYSGQSVGSALQRFAEGLALYVALASPLWWVLAVRESAGARPDAVRVGAATALLLAWIPVSLGGRFYGHYYIQFVPALALLAAPRAAALLARWGELARGLRVTLTLALLIPAIGWLMVGYIVGFAGLYPGQNTTARELGHWLREHTPPTSKVFLWGHYSPIYYFAQRLPGSRFQRATSLIGDFDPMHIPEGFDLRPYLSRRDLALTLADLESRRPEYFVDTTPSNLHGWSKIPLSLIPELERLVATDYEVVARPARCIVYRRRLPSGARTP